MLVMDHVPAHEGASDDWATLVDGKEGVVRMLTCHTSAPAVYSLPLPFQFRRQRRYAEARVSACMTCV